MLKSKRIHDKFYIKEKIKVKESFKFLFKEIKKLKFSSLIDVGCSNGSFLNFLAKRYKKKELAGADVDKELILLAKKRTKGIKFIKLDISKKIRKNMKKFDIVVLSGVHTIYDNIEPLIKNSQTLCKKGGYLFLFGSFNPTNYDVITRVKKFNSLIWEKGFNRPSVISTQTIFKKYFKSIKIKKFNFNQKIEENKKDPRRTFTKDLRSNKKITINGLEQISTKFLIYGKKNAKN